MHSGRSLRSLLGLAVAVASVSAAAGCAEVREEELDEPVEEQIVSGEPAPPLGVYRLESDDGQRGGSITLSAATAKAITFQVKGIAELPEADPLSGATGGRALKENGVYVFRDDECTIHVTLDFAQKKLNVAQPSGNVCGTTPIDFSGAYALAR